MGTARTERGSSHSSWKGSRLLATPATAACLMCRPDIVCPNRLGGMMQPAKAAHGAFLARPSWGPRKAGWLCGERRSSVVIELSCLHGSERYAACFDEVVARAVRVSQPAVLSALLVIQLSGIVIPPPIFLLKSTKRSAAAILGRSAPSLLFMVRFGIFCCRQDFLPCSI